LHCKDKYNEIKTSIPLSIAVTIKDALTTKANYTRLKRRKFLNESIPEFPRGCNNFNYAFDFFFSNLILQFHASKISSETLL
jgi:hypothetical protein